MLKFANKIEIPYDAGEIIEYHNDESALTWIKVVVNTAAMEDFADWKNAWVKAAYPIK